MPKPPEDLRRFSSFVEIVAHLRGPEGCPWDKEQTHQSLTPYALEEAFELVEAIDSGDPKNMAEELGDVLLQVVLHAEIAQQAGQFNIDDVVESIAEKMVRRHPHVFAKTEVSGSDEVTENWEQIKAAEKGEKPSEIKGFGVPKALPALLAAHKIGAKSKKYNFDWETADQVLEKVEEEFTELKEALTEGKVDEQRHEVGDLLFSVSQLARHLGFDAEQALRQCNSRFETRFKKMQELALEKKLQFDKLDRDELEELYKSAKTLVD